VVVLSKILESVPTPIRAILRCTRAIPALDEFEDATAATQAKQPTSRRKDLISARLPPLISEGDIGERNTADWSELTHWLADEQRGIRMDVRKQPERGLGVFLELQIKRRQSRAEADALSLPAACSALPDRSMTQRCASVCRLRGKG
jgi:hypothetical protein